MLIPSEEFRETSLSLQCASLSYPRCSRWATEFRNYLIHVFCPGQFSLFSIVTFPNDPCTPSSSSTLIGWSIILGWEESTSKRQMCLRNLRDIKRMHNGRRNCRRHLRCWLWRLLSVSNLLKCSGILHFLHVWWFLWELFNGYMIYDVKYVDTYPLSAGLIASSTCSTSISTNNTYVRNPGYLLY